MTDADATTSTQSTQPACRGVRGATYATGNTREAIHEAIRELVLEIVAANGIEPDDIASALFTTTPDLTAAFPAEAIRQMGWEYVPMLGATEMDKDGALPFCIRVMFMWNTTLGPREIRHVYLRGTEALRSPAPASDATVSS